MGRTVPVVIDSFTGDFAFLDPCFPSDLVFDGLRYPSAEHAYQASKTNDENTRIIITNLLDGATARSYGKSRLKAPPGFSRVRLGIMRRILEAKFFDNIPLAKMLIETMDSTLLYPARGNDLFWGCRNRGKNGENQLGKLLMDIRAQMRAATERAAEVRLSRVKFSGGLGIDDLRSKLANVTGLTPTEFQSEYMQDPYKPEPEPLTEYQKRTGAMPGDPRHPHSDIIGHNPVSVNAHGIPDNRTIKLIKGPPIPPPPPNPLG